MEKNQDTMANCTHMYYWAHTLHPQANAPSRQVCSMQDDLHLEPGNSFVADAETYIPNDTARNVNHAVSILKLSTLIPVLTTGN